MIERPIILCVDDERVILDGLKSQLSRDFSNDYEIEIADSGEYALEIIYEAIKSGREIPVLIADQIMPGMKGNELLKTVNRVSDKIFKILLTGQAGINDVADALNNANLYRYIQKPWDGVDLVLTVREALRSFYQDKKLEEQNVMLKRYNDELEVLVKERTQELEIEKNKADKLLLNILPAETARELKDHGFSLPRHYDLVSILFTDIKGFTSIAAKMTPNDLVKRLGECFNAFDEIIVKYNLEKIKTIGDAYMCAGGIPKTNSTHPVDIIHAAHEMLDWVNNWNITQLNNNEERWVVRIGVHTGSLVAGVIGSSKFAYDVWGDTVNIASRIESAGEPGRINISGDTYNLVNSDFNCTYRGKIDTKNRGAIEMYFIDPKQA
jgi:class 3 adenylate cyclase/FixJ family two-component response regulator